MTAEVSAVLACVLLAGLSIFQVLLIAGLPLGKFAWGGAHTVLPAKLRIGSVVSVCMYLLFAMLILEKAGLVSLLASNAISDIGMWVVTGYLSLGIALNAISRSKPERLVMTPVAAALAVLFLHVALQ